MADYFGGVEAGGTKFVCVVASGPDEVLAEARFPTTTPEETMANTLSFFREQEKFLGSPLRSIGVGCFGPVDLQPGSPTYGYITSTPKPGWKDTAIVSPLSEAFNIPVAFDTDVNVAALGEGAWGEGRGLTDFVYITIGTGVGGGVICSGKPVHGLVHEEVGHIRLPHDLQRDPFAGCCPYHGDCLEGLASGTAMFQRWGKTASGLPEDHPAWEIETEYLALAIQNLVCILSPQRFILGGGVMNQTHLFPRIRRRVLELLNGYVQSKHILDQIDTYIVPPGLGNRAGSLGAIFMAMRAVQS